MANNDTRELIVRLKAYFATLERHLSQVNIGNEQLKNQWLRFNSVSEGNYADQFRTGWEKTQAQFYEYINQSKKIIDLLENRLQYLIEVDREKHFGLGNSNISFEHRLTPPAYNAYNQDLEANFIAPFISILIFTAFLLGDLQIIKDFIDPSSNYKKKMPPFLVLQGDLGELKVWKMLTAEDGIDNIDALEIDLKPQNFYNKSGRLIKPDFYIKSHNLICDAKAYKAASVEKYFNNLVQTADKYADALEAGGEVRFYFPHDTYEQQKDLLKNICDYTKIKHPSINFRILTLPVNYQEIRWRTKFYFIFMKNRLFVNKNN